MTFSLAFPFLFTAQVTEEETVVWPCEGLQGSCYACRYIRKIPHREMPMSPLVYLELRTSAAAHLRAMAAGKHLTPDLRPPGQKSGLKRTPACADRDSQSRTSSGYTLFRTPCRDWMDDSFNVGRSLMEGC